MKQNYTVCTRFLNLSCSKRTFNEVKRNRSSNIEDIRINES